MKRFPTGMPWVPLKGDEERPNNGRLAFVMLLKEDQVQRMRQIAREISDTSGLTKFAGRNAWMMEMQSNHKANDSMEVKRIKEKTIESVKSHGSMMLSLGQARIPGLYNVNKVHLIKQVNKKGEVKILKKSIASILDYLKWEDERVFQSVWEMEDGSVMAFFSNVIPDIETYVDNWMMCPAANIHWFLIKKGCDEGDVTEMLGKCFSPDELAKINRVSYNGPLAVLKERYHLDMATMVRN